MIALFIFIGIVVVYTTFALLIERRNGQPSHDQRRHSGSTNSRGNWTGRVGYGGGLGGDFGGGFGGGDCGGGFGGGDCGGF